MAVEMYGVTFSFVQNGLSSLMNWPRPQGVCVQKTIFFLLSQASCILHKKNSISKVLSALKMDCIFSH